MRDITGVIAILLVVLTLLFIGFIDNTIEELKKDLEFYKTGYEDCIGMPQHLR